MATTGAISSKFQMFDNFAYTNAPRPPFEDKVKLPKQHFFFTGQQPNRDPFPMIGPNPLAQNVPTSPNNEKGALT